MLAFFPETLYCFAMKTIDPCPIIDAFYPGESPLKTMLLVHSRQVCAKALAILDLPENQVLALDRELVRTGALLHDIGIGRCHAPGIFCTGDLPYLAHGIAGAAMLRQYGREHGLDLEAFARIAERHTGSGLTREEIEREALPLPPRDFLPETPEEKLICLADKFYSKSGNMQEKSMARVRQGMAKFGPAPLARFDALCQLFHWTANS